MFQFVYWLKAFAAILITNSHYADIWPVSRLAMGGHLGNCLYFLYPAFAYTAFEIRSPDGMQSGSSGSILRSG